MSNKLLPFQAQALTWLAPKPKAFLAAEQGLGKSVMGAIDLVTPAIVVCPSSMKWTWFKELSIWRPELTVQVIQGSKSKLQAADVHIINYDILDKVDLPQCVTLIADECHYAKSYKAKRTKALTALIKNAQRVRLLSGTPIVNRPIEIWPLLYAIKATKLGYFEFGMRYCKGWKTPWDTYDFSGSSRHEELNSILQPIMLRLTKAQVLPELPEKTFKVIELDLAIDKREKAFSLAEVQKPDSSIPFEAISDILHMNAHRKLPLAIEHIISALESSQKIVVFANHTDIVDELMTALKVYKPVRVTGRDKAESRRDSVEKFQNDPSCRVFVGNIKAAGVGLTLTAASHIVFVESSWSPADIAQCADRCHRIGQKNAVLAEILTIHNSIDAHVLHKALSKMEVINLVIKETDMNKELIAAKLRELAELFEAVEKETRPVKETFSPEEAPVQEVKAEQPAAVTLNNVREMLAKLIDAGKRDKAISILKNNGAAKVGDLKEDKFNEVVSQCKDQLAAE